MEDALKEIKEELRSRKCPYCGALIKNYMLVAQIIPYEGHAINAVTFAENAKMNFPVIFLGNMALTQLMRIILSSTCKCGNISLWNFNMKIFAALTSDDMNNDEYGIEKFYVKNKIQNMQGHASNPAEEGLINDLLKQFPAPKDDSE